MARKNSLLVGLTAAFVGAALSAGLAIMLTGSDDSKPRRSTQERTRASVRDHGRMHGHSQRRASRHIRGKARGTSTTGEHRHAGSSPTDESDACEYECSDDYGEYDQGAEATDTGNDVGSAPPDTPPPPPDVSAPPPYTPSPPPDVSAP